MNRIARAELLAVGTELLLGETNDTNTAYLAASLADNGVDVYWSQRVGDNLTRVSHAISQALERSDLLVITGGLGPTEDDLTREAIAAVLDEHPSVDGELEAVLRERFSRSSREMPVANLKQAWLIPSAMALANPLGTAPGWLVRHERGGRACYVVALPGPPREMSRMWAEEALPRLPLAPSHLQRVTLKTWGIGESTVAELLADLTPEANPSVATYARQDGVHVRIAAKSKDEHEARALVTAAADRIGSRLAEWIWGADEDELPTLVVSALQRRGLTVATFEEATAGTLVGAISAVPGGQDACRGGMVAWAPQTMAALGLPRPAAYGTSAPEIAVGMAEAVRETFSADVGVAVLSGAPPTAGRQGQTTDEAVVAVQASGEPVWKHLSLPPLPAAWRRERITNLALFLLWSRLR
ncbi:MAG: CinA family nicotinamide mononucleotide deamidase-related protein [Trueperaceae bacterium]